MIYLGLYQTLWDLRDFFRTPRDFHITVNFEGWIFIEQMFAASSTYTKHISVAVDVRWPISFSSFPTITSNAKKKREQQQIWRSKHQLNHNSVCLFALQTPREVKLYNRNCLSLAFTTEDTESLYHFL